MKAEGAIVGKEGVKVETFMSPRSKYSNKSLVNDTVLWLVKSIIV